MASIACGGACIAGGIILLLLESQSSHGYSLTGNNVYETLGHGAGLYAIGRGLFMWLVLYQAADASEAVARYMSEARSLLRGREHQVVDEDTLH